MHHTIFLTTPISLELDQLWNLLPFNHISPSIFDLAFKGLPVHRMTKILPLAFAHCVSSMNVCFPGYRVGTYYFPFPSFLSPGFFTGVSRLVTVRGILMLTVNYLGEIKIADVSVLRDVGPPGSIYRHSKRERRGEPLIPCSYISHADSRASRWC